MSEVIVTAPTTRIPQCLSPNDQAFARNAVDWFHHPDAGRRASTIAPERIEGSFFRWIGAPVTQAQCGVDE